MSTTVDYSHEDRPDGAGHRKAARARGSTFEVVRSSGKHDIWRLGATVQIPIPRHGEIGPKMEFEIRKQCEPELGPRWWR